MKPLDLVAMARAVAVVAHGDQKYGEAPYVAHLDAVAELVRGYGPQYVTVAYLHDTLEDTDLRYAQIAGMFGEYVAECVELVSDEGGRNRAARKAATNAKLAALTRDHDVALIVKAADRLANVRAGGKVDMYRKEHAAFRAACYREGLCPEIWAELDARLSDPIGVSPCS